MSLRRLPISAAALAAVAVLGLAACGDTKTKTVTVTATPTSGTAAESGKTVHIIASVPPTDHGWLGQIAAKAQAAADTFPDVDFRLLEAADADSQASQIETGVAVSIGGPTFAVVLGAALIAITLAAVNVTSPEVRDYESIGEPEQGAAG